MQRAGIGSGSGGGTGGGTDLLGMTQGDTSAMQDQANQPLGGGSSDPGMLSEENSFLQTMRDQQLTGDAYDQMIAQQQAGVDPSLNDPYAGYGGSQGLLGITNPYQQQPAFTVSDGLKN